MLVELVAAKAAATLLLEEIANIAESEDSENE